MARTSGGKIRFGDLRAILSSTEPTWRPGLEALLRRAHFVLGSEGSAFETEFAAAVGARFAIGTSSGTSALELSLRATRVPQKGVNEVITSPLTAPFTAVAIVAAGYQPRFADVDESTLLLDPTEVRRRLTNRTAAIIPVHLYGQPYDIRSLRSCLKNPDLPIIQDACQAHGATSDGVPFTSSSQFVAYSFYPTKNLGCIGDGGAIVTNSAVAARTLRSMRDGGRVQNQISSTPGSTNARLDEVQACFLRAWLPFLAEWNERRRKQAALYQEALSGCEGIRIVLHRPGSVFHLFVIRAKWRSQLRAYLIEAGIETGIHYPQPLHRHPAFRLESAKQPSFPKAEKACREILSLPLRPGLTDASILRVAEHIQRFYRRSQANRNFNK